MAEPEWALELLTDKHDRATFDCGEAALDEFLRKYARQNAERGVSRTIVAVRPKTSAVSGYYTVRTGAVSFELLPEKDRKLLPRYPVPVVHLARLAVDVRERGRGLGELLLLDAFARALRLSTDVGIHGVEVVAKNDGARRFYRQYGLKPLTDDEHHLYISLKVVRAALGGR